MPRCQKCNGTRWYSYDENHSKVCEACCKHSRYWVLLEDYNDRGQLCCKDGCGQVINKKDRKVIKNGSMEVYIRP